MGVARFRGESETRADFSGARLEGADLHDARELTITQVSSAFTDSKTQR